MDGTWDNALIQAFQDAFPVGTRIRIKKRSGASCVGTISAWGPSFVATVDAPSVTKYADLEDMDEAASAVPDPPEQRPKLQRQYVPVPQYKPFSFCFDEKTIKLLQTQVQRIEYPALKKEFNRILDIVRSAQKNHSLREKAAQISAELHRLWGELETEEEFDCFYLFLGVSRLGGEQYYDAMEPLIRCGHYLLAAYAAEKAGRVAARQTFYLGALLREEPGAALDLFALNACVEQQTAEPLLRLLDRWEKDPPENSICEVMASCAAQLCSVAGVGSDVAQVIDPPLDAARKLLLSMPASWREGGALMLRLDEYAGYTYPVVDSGNQDNSEYIGYLCSYSPAGGGGYLQNGETKEIRRFHMEQVRDEKEEHFLLRLLLEKGRYHDLEVRYKLSEDEDGACCADCIELTEPAVEKAKSLLSTPYHTGKIKNYFADKKQGYISESGASQDRSFIDGNVTDPRMLKMLQNGETYKLTGQKVSFLCANWSNPNRSRMKIVAADIVRLDPLLYDGPALTPKEAEEYERVLRERSDLKAMKLAPPTADPCPGRRYHELDPWIDQGDMAQAVPLTWSADTWPAAPSSDTIRKQEKQKRTAPAPTPAPTPRPAPAPTPDPVSAPTPAPTLTTLSVSDGVKKLLSSGKSPAELARIGQEARTSGDLVKAEDHLKAALLAGQTSSSIVGDLNTTLLQRYRSDPERLKAEALPLLDRYASEIEPMKLLNMRISIFDQIHDFEKLVPLLEEVIRLTPTLAKRSYLMVRRMIALNNTGRYADVLQACEQWQRMYAQNSYDPEIGRLRSAENTVLRNKAIALYHQNRRDEAKTIATDLLRANPNDKAANQIMDNTLPEINPIVTDLDLMDLQEDGDGEKADLSRFEQYLISQTDVNSLLKGRFVNDKYVGDVKKAKEDVRTLSEYRKGDMRGGNTAKTRSDRLFAACRIIDGASEIAGEPVLQNLKLRCAGRAMAAWGDYMLGQTRRMDTSRMAYLSVVEKLAATHKGMEQNWADAYNRFLRSYFDGRDKLEEYIRRQNESSSKDGPDEDSILRGRIQPALLREFTVGLLQILEALRDQPKQRKVLIGSLFRNNSKLSEEVIDQLRKSFPEAERTVNTAEEFSAMLDSARLSTRRLRENLDKSLREAAELLMQGQLPHDRMSALEPSKWIDVVPFTDYDRLTQLYRLFQSTQDFFRSAEFEVRAGALRTITTDASALLSEILKEPTDFSFDCLQPVLMQIKTEVAAQRELLFRDLGPKLIWGPAPMASETKERLVLVQLAVENTDGHEAVRTLRVAGSTAGEIRVRHPDEISVLRGGETEYLNLTLDVPAERMAEGSFELELPFVYSYEGENGADIQDESRVSFNVVLPTGEELQYKNIYSGFIGNPVEDPSMFYGRDEIINTLVQTVHNAETGRMIHGHAMAIYGQTRCGKSSIFHHLKERLQKTYGEHVIVWDMENIASIQYDRKELFVSRFLDRLVSRGELELYQNERIAARMMEEDLEVPDLSKLPENAAGLLDRFMNRLSRILEDENCIIVIMADEFTKLYDGIRAGTVPEDFMEQWKGWLQSYPVFTFVIGQDNMREFMAQYTNAFQCMEIREITYLDKTSAKRLIREPLERVTKRELFDDESTELIYQQTAGSAFLTMIVCASLVDYMNARQVRHVNRGVVKDFLNNWFFTHTEKLSKATFEPQMHERGHAEWDDAYEALLYAIAEASSVTGWGPEDEILRLARQRRPENAWPVSPAELLNRLSERRIVVREGSRYQIQVRLLSTWLNHEIKREKGGY